MSSTLDQSPLAKVLAPVTDCLTRDVAERLVNLRVDDTVQARIDELADRCTEGALSPREREEYESYVQAIDLVSLLQARARRKLVELNSQS